VRFHVNVYNYNLFLNGLYINHTFFGINQRKYSYKWLTKTIMERTKQKVRAIPLEMGEG